MRNSIDDTTPLYAWCTRKDTPDAIARRLVKHYVKPGEVAVVELPDGENVVRFSAANDHGIIHWSMRAVPADKSYKRVLDVGPYVAPMVRWFGSSDDLTGKCRAA